MAAPATGATQSTTTTPSGRSSTTSPTTPAATSNSVTQQGATSKPSYSSKLGGVKGRQPENSGTVSTQRQQPAQRAWSTGNPLAQRAANQSPATVSTNGAKAAGSSGLLREGLRVKITLDSGAEFEGIFSSGTDSTYTLRTVQLKKSAGITDNTNGTVRSASQQPSMSFSKKDVVDIHVTGASLPLRDAKQQNGNSFRTDAAISGNKFQGERPLQRWVPDEGIETDMSLEAGPTRGSGAAWDQFAVNEKLFGVTTNYDETIYTTTIDRSHPDYRKRYAEADKKAREIEGSLANNRHIAEERIADNLNVDDSGLDEEDKYSGVQKHDFPPLTASGAPNKYMPPALRTAKPQQPPTTPAGAVLGDPAIISASRPTKAPVEATKPAPSANATKHDISTPPTTTESSFTATPELKSTPATTSISASRTQSPQAKPAAGAPSATATVEHDVVSAFKGFAQQQRVQADRLRSNKAKADKEVKLHELKKFAATFKLNSPLPTDLVGIIAKDPAKQIQIQETARRNAEEAQKKKLANAVSAEAPSAVSTAPDPKTAQRPVAPQGTTPTSAAPARLPSGRSGPNGNFAPQAPYNSQTFRNDRSPQSQTPQNQGRPGPTLSARLQNIEMNKNGKVNPSSEPRQPPTGPANATEPNFSRRSSGAISMMAPKLNPNSHEFRPNAGALPFNPTGTTAIHTVVPSLRPIPIPTTADFTPPPQNSFLRKKTQASPKQPVIGDEDIITATAKITPPAGKNWASNGDFKPAWESAPTWRQIRDDEPKNSTMNLTYVNVLERSLFKKSISSPQPSNTPSQTAHQHQLPFHLQHGAHNLSQRQSPRQPPTHVHNNHQNHGPNGSFNGADDHRMMPSHSAQSYASPRLQQVTMAYPTPMGQSPQLSFNQPGMQYQMGPGGPPMQQFRSYSGGAQFIPQQASHMGGPIMMGPAGGPFIGPPGGPQLMYPVQQQPHFIPAGSGPQVPLTGSNGYPSPGRSAPMMMTGSQPGQQGQPVYGMSPGMQYGQPIYAQQQPGQMPNMRGYQGQQHFGTSPQMHQYPQSHRGGPGHYNKNYHQNNQQHHNSHPPNQQTHAPSGGPQNRPADGGDEAK